MAADRQTSRREGGDRRGGLRAGMLAIRTYHTRGQRVQYAFEHLQRSRRRTDADGRTVHFVNLPARAPLASSWRPALEEARLPSAARAAASSLPIFVRERERYREIISQDRRGEGRGKPRNLPFSRNPSRVSLDRVLHGFLVRQPSNGETAVTSCLHTHGNKWMSGASRGTS